MDQNTLHAPLTSPDSVTLIRVIWCLNGDWWLEVDVESPRPKNIWMLYSLYRLFTSPVSCMALGYALLHGESLGMVEKQNLWKASGVNANFLAVKYALLL